MLTITIPCEELFDEATGTFSPAGEDVILELEHSLVSLSKWESIHQVPFLSAGEMTPEQIFSYIECMVVSGDPANLYRCQQKDLDRINEYINSPQSATTFGSTPSRRGSSEIVTAELIYYWMVAYQIPLEAEQWHLNRLFSLIKIAGIKNSKQKKMPQREIAQRNRDLNAERKAKLGTSG